MAVKPHVLVVEDDEAVGAMLGAYVEKAGYRVSLVPDGLGMRAVLDTMAVDLVLLDLNLPDANGMSLARELRNRSNLNAGIDHSSMGIIMVTDRTAPADRALGLEIGADDYVTKPVYPRELVARIKNVLDRRAPSSQGGDQNVYRFGEWMLDVENRSLIGQDKSRPDLTPAEFDVLAMLVTRAGRMQTRDQMMAALSDSDSESSPRSVDVLVSRIRRKLNDERANPMIETCRGHGYKFIAEVARG